MNIPDNAEMPQLSPEMMKQMPPEAIEQMKQGMATLETMRNVPQENKDIVAPLTPQIDAWTASHYE